MVLILCASYSNTPSYLGVTMNTHMTRIFMTQSLILLGFVFSCALASNVIFDSDPGAPLQKSAIGIDLCNEMQPCTRL